MTPFEEYSTECFDREFTLRDLLRGIDGERLLAALRVLLEKPVRLVDADRENLMPQESKGETKLAAGIPLRGELETIGALEADVATERLRAAADLVELMLQAGARYLMTSNLHKQTQQADYEELQKRHAALEKSEARYKALTETLEQRVKEQVKTIETARLKLYQSEKLASVGRLAAGIAHEINNPIGFIRSNLSTARAYLDKMKEVGELIESGGAPDRLRAAWRDADMAFILEDFDALLGESVEGADRVANIVTDMKGFSRVDGSEEEEADINEIIRQVCSVAATWLKGRAEVRLELGPLPKVHCHAGEMGQLFFGLLTNAADAMTGFGEIRFRTRARDGTVRIEVSDNGCGIQESALPHIFEPFFTTKDVGQGIGLGLTVCDQVIKAHGGALDVESKAGEGTTFTISLPLGAAPAAQPTGPSE